MGLSRRKFIRQGGFALFAISLPSAAVSFTKPKNMKDKNQYDAIIVGGSYSGLSAAMALGRALRTVLVIDSGQPCNAQTPHSHNFLTHDGDTPAEIAKIAREQVESYPNVAFCQGTATDGRKTENGFEIQIKSGTVFRSSKVIFATGVRDIMPDIEGFQECWGISAIHCPYCHGYEVRHTKTGILGNSEQAFEFTKLISNWTKDLTLYTNGPVQLSKGQLEELQMHNIGIVELELEKLEHKAGKMSHLCFRDGSKMPLTALYAPRPFEQHCSIPLALGCEMTEDGYIKTNPFQETSIPGIYACGDNITRIRTVANAVAMGTAAGMACSKKLILEQF